MKIMNVIKEVSYNRTNNMDIKEICLLIAQLKKENETNSPEEKEFNLKWIEALKESIDKSVNKNKED